MFPLKTDVFPANAADLARHLNDSLRDVFQLPIDPVTIREVSYPHLALLAVSLDGAEWREQLPPVPSPAGKASPALTVDSFTARGAEMSVGPAVIDFSMTARDVQLNQVTDRQGEIVLLLQSAGEGQVEASISRADLEALVAEVARREASKHGVAIQSVHLSLRSQSARSLAAEVRMRARKMFVTTSLRITGQVNFDQELNARISGLDCVGDGAIASAACGILKPHLQKVEGRELPLMSLPLGEVRLRDVRLTVGEKLSVTAEFGVIT